MREKLLGALLVATVALMIGGIDIYLPTLPSLAHIFGTTSEFLQITVIISPLTSAFVAFIWGRQANYYSHKSLMLLAVSIFGIGALLCTLATNGWIFLGARFIQAIGGSGLSILSMVLLYDVFKTEKEHATYMALYGAMFPPVFALAPMIGAQLFCRFGWRSSFYFVFFVSFVFFLMYWFLLPKKKTNVKDEEEKGRTFLKIKNLLRSKLYMAYVLGHALPIAISMLFTTNSAFIFQEYYGFDPILFSFVQCLPILINFIGTFYYRSVLKKKSIQETIYISGYSLIAFLALLIPILFFGITLSPAFLIGVVSVYMFYMSFSLSSCGTRAIESRSKDRSIAVAMLSTFRNLVGSSVVIISGFFYNNTPYSMLSSMFVVSLILCILILVIIPKLQEK